MNNKYLDIMSVGLLPVYQYSKKLEESNLAEFKEFHRLLRENNPSDVYLAYLEFEKKLNGGKVKDFEYDLFLCDL